MMQQTKKRWIGLAILAGVMMSGGCAAFRPIPGVPARSLAPELLAVSRNNESTIDLSKLAQVPPRQHLVDAGDVLGIYIEGVLGRPGEAPPITVPTTPDLPPSLGYPITVRDDGSLSLPLIDAVDVRGMTIRQVEEKLRELYTREKDILRTGQERIIVSLQRPRQVRVLVLRQETGGPGGTEFSQGLSINLGQTKRGNGQAVDLPIYKNDVLHALAKTGGLPGLDAENTIYIIRRQYLPHQGYLPPMSQPYQPQYQPSYQPQYQPQYYPAQGMPLSSTGVDSNAAGSQSRSAQQSVIQQVHYQETTTETYGYSGDYTAGSPVQPLPYQQQQYQQEQYQQISQQQYAPPAGGYSIQPVQARNFQRTNPLDELRAGMNGGNDTGFLSESQYADTLDYEPGQMGGDYPVYQPPQEQYSYGQEPYLPGPGQYEMPPYEMQTLPPTQPWQPSAGSGPQGYAGQPAPVLTPAYDPRFSPSMPALDSFCQNLQDPAFSWANVADPTMNNPQVIKIPIRLKPGENPHIRPEDIVLHDGDILFIETRETEIYYTGGLLGGGQYTLPRDYDLDVLGAISIAQASSPQQVGRQLGGASAINGDVTISASDVIILRQMPNGGQVPIKIDLYRAIRDPSERVIIQPGDIVMLRYKPLEAVGAFIERNLLESALFGLAASQMPSSGR